MLKCLLWAATSLWYSIYKYAEKQNVILKFASVHRHDCQSSGFSGLGEDIPPLEELVFTLLYDLKVYCISQVLANDMG